MAENVESGSVRTDAFKQSLQKTFGAILGQKISKDKAWALFKGGINTAVDFVVESDEPLSLAGVGRFEILKSKPRGQKTGRVPFVPRFKFRPSSRISKQLEEHYGVSLDKTAAVSSEAGEPVEGAEAVEAGEDVELGLDIDEDDEDAEDSEESGEDLL